MVNLPAQAILRACAGAGVARAGVSCPLSTRRRLCVATGSAFDVPSGPGIICMARRRPVSGGYHANTGLAVPGKSDYAGQEIIVSGRRWCGRACGLAMAAVAIPRAMNSDRDTPQLTPRLRLVRGATARPLAPWRGGRRRSARACTMTAGNRPMDMR